MQSIQNGYIHIPLVFRVLVPQFYRVAGTNKIKDDNYYDYTLIRIF